MIIPNAEKKIISYTFWGRTISYTFGESTNDGRGTANNTLALYYAGWAVNRLTMVSE